MRKARDSNQSRSLLVNLSNHLKAKIDLGQVSRLDVFESVQSRIASIDLAAAKGAQVRARVRWAEEGETSSKYFFRLEKKRGADNWISAMKSSDGNIVSDISGICDPWVSFYSALPIRLFRTNFLMHLVCPYLRIRWLCVMVIFLLMKPLPLSLGDSLRERMVSRLSSIFLFGM